MSLLRLGVIKQSKTETRYLAEKLTQSHFEQYFSSSTTEAVLRAPQIQPEIGSIYGLQIMTEHFNQASEALVQTTELSGTSPRAFLTVMNQRPVDYTIYVHVTNMRQRSLT